MRRRRLHRHEDVDLASNQFAGETLQPIRLSIREPVFADHVDAFDPTQLAKPLLNRLQEPLCARAEREVADPRDSRRRLRDDRRRCQSREHGEEISATRSRHGVFRPVVPSVCLVDPRRLDGFENLLAAVLRIVVEPGQRTHPLV